MEEIFNLIQKSNDEDYIKQIIKNNDLKNYNKYDDVDYFMYIANYLLKKKFYKAYYYLLKNGSPKFLLAYSNNSETTPSVLKFLKQIDEKYTNKSYKIIKSNINTSNLERIINLEKKSMIISFKDKNIIERI
uniref:Uncharacterized protein n=1 Tax=viral metagenome TaxID=1070528 RepID=A0A6C0AE07_9ZZZZ